MKRLIPVFCMFVCSAVGVLVGATPTYACDDSDDATTVSIKCPDYLPGIPAGYGNPEVHRATRCTTEPYKTLSASALAVYVDSLPSFAPDPNDIAFWGYGVPSSWVLGGTKRHEYQLYLSSCDDQDGNEQPGSVRSGWVKVVSVENLTNDILFEVIAKISKVQPTWPTVSPKNHWQMVKVPLEIRGNVPAPVSKSKSASNVSGSATVTVSATPSFVEFYSGDNDPTVRCPVEMLSWRVPAANQPSPCSYTYIHSSVQREGRPFQTTLRTVWILQTPDPRYNGEWPLSPVATDLLVAETQALVMSQG